MLNPQQHNSYEDDEDSDWDSEPELEVARVQEAARLSRRVPSIHSKPITTISNNNQQQHTAIAAHFATNKSKRPAGEEGGTSPYYCQEIGPQLDLGYQWPQQPIYETKGFVKVNAGNILVRQRQVDKILLTQRQKVTN